MMSPPGYRTLHLRGRPVVNFVPRSLTMKVNPIPMIYVSLKRSRSALSNLSLECQLASPKHSFFDRFRNSKGRKTGDFLKQMLLLNSLCYEKPMGGPF